MKAPNGTESSNFLGIPMPVPPMIEDAMRYRGEEQYVCLGFGVHGARMSDFASDGFAPRSPGLYRMFLTHPLIRPHTEAFQIEVDPPDWLLSTKIEEVQNNAERIAEWSETARCLLLDRESRQFFAGTVSQIRSWLMVRPALYPRRKQCPQQSRGHRIARAAERLLWTWLDGQPSATLDERFVDQWEKRFREGQAVAGCVGAGIKLGFNAHAIREMVSEAICSSSR